MPGGRAIAGIVTNSSPIAGGDGFNSLVLAGRGVTYRINSIVIDNPEVATMRYVHLVLVSDGSGNAANGVALLTKVRVPPGNPLVSSLRLDLYPGQELRVKEDGGNELNVTAFGEVTG